MNSLSKALFQELVLLSIIIIGATSCQQTSTTVNDKLGQPIKIQTLCNSATISTDTTVSYSFYLPKTYNGNDKLPVIFFFDPQGDGSLPINNYLQLADKYGYIFIGSNNIMNGQSAGYTRQVFVKLLAEAKTRLVIDNNRLFTAGFSGGAKIASFFAQQMSEIVGVAACGASIPNSNNVQPNYYYAGIVGNRDFNYLEVQQTFTVFSQRGFDYTSVVFNGGHQWPSVSSFEIALIGFNIYSIKTKQLDENTEWLDNVWNRMSDSIYHFNEVNDIINENIYLNQTMRWFYGLRNTNELRKRSINIMQGKRFNVLIKNRQKLIQTEVKLRSEFIRAIELRNIDWWITEIEHINKSVAKGDSEVAQVSHRLLNYISMVSFMLIKTDLENNRIETVAHKLKIYELVDSTNPDVYLMYARYYLLQNNIEGMKQSFIRAQELGFSNYSTYKSQPLWSVLFSQNEIVPLIEE